MSPLSSHCKPAQASQGSYWLFLDPPGQAILVAWLPNTMHQPNQSTWDSGNNELPKDELFPTQHLLLRYLFFSAYLEDPSSVSNLFLGGHPPAEVNPDILRPRLVWYPMDKFCISHILQHSHSILHCNINFQFSASLVGMKSMGKATLPRVQLMAHSQERSFGQPLEAGEGKEKAILL